MCEFAPSHILMVALLGNNWCALDMVGHKASIALMVAQRVLWHKHRYLGHLAATCTFLGLERTWLSKL